MREQKIQHFDSRMSTHYLIHELPVVHMHAPQPSYITNKLPGPVCVAHQHHSSVQLCKTIKPIQMTIVKFNMKAVTIMIMMIGINWDQGGPPAS